MLIHQRDLDTDTEGTLPPRQTWFLPLYRQIQARFAHPAGTLDGFPCVFAQNAFKRKNVRFSLVPVEHGKYRLSELQRDLVVFLDEGKAWDGSPNTSEPLLVVFEKTAKMPTEREYQNQFDEIVQYLVDHDPDPWPDHTHTDPASPYWSMCYHGIQIFVNVSHPRHTRRRSRNLCDTLVLVINPRERFDRVAGPHEKGDAIREQIRRNVDAYDQISRSPLLDHYLSGGLEWPQYMLPDDNTTPPRRCPLRFKVLSD